MLKRMIWILVALFLLLTTAAEAGRISKIKRLPLLTGLSKSQVARIIGQPDNFSADHWFYRFNASGMDVCVAIRFYNNTVHRVVAAGPSICHYTDSRVLPKEIVTIKPTYVSGEPHIFYQINKTRYMWIVSMYYRNESEQRAFRIGDWQNCKFLRYGECILNSPVESGYMPIYDEEYH